MGKRVKGEREIDRDRDRQTDRQRHRETDRVITKKRKNCIF